MLAAFFTRYRASNLVFYRHGKRNDVSRNERRVSPVRFRSARSGAPDCSSAGRASKKASCACRANKAPKKVHPAKKMVKPMPPGFGRAGSKPAKGTDKHKRYLVGKAQTAIKQRLQIVNTVLCETGAAPTAKKMGTGRRLRCAPVVKTAPR